MTVKEFFEELYGDLDGAVELRWPTRNGVGMNSQWVHSAEEFELYADTGRADLYFGVGVREDGRRKKADILSWPAVWCDLDLKTFSSIRQAVDAIRCFSLRPTIIVATGGGFHLYWRLREDAGREDLERLEAINRGLAKALGGDVASCDGARILRVPGTLNMKYNPPRVVQVVEHHDIHYNLSDFDDYRDEGRPVRAENGDAMVEVFERCAFLRHCRENAATLSEIEWYYMISNLSRIPGGVGKIHEVSQPYPGYSRRETDRKILQAIDGSYPVRCEVIADIHDGCYRCEYRRFGTSPARVHTFKGVE